MLMGAYEYGFEGCFITNCNPAAGGMMLEWTAFPMWEATVKWSTNLIIMPFTDLATPMPFPANCFTDLVHGAANCASIGLSCNRDLDGSCVCSIKAWWTHQQVVPSSCGHEPAAVAVRVT